MTTVYQLNHAACEKIDLPCVLTIAGSDSSGGAGIEADLKTFSAFGVYGLTCIAALTAQNTKGVKGFDKTSSDLIKQILQANLYDFLFDYEIEQAPLKVIKTGMLTKEAIQEISHHLVKLKQYKIKLVIDPVMVSTSGSKLIDKEGMNLCVNKLMKDAYLITPNFPEAMELYKTTSSQIPKVESLDDYVQFVKDLQNSLRCTNLLVKGGHIPFNKENKISQADPRKIIDVLYRSEDDKLYIFESKYIDSLDNHGSGCTLASAIAANLAKNKPLDESILLSIDYVHKGMSSLSRKLGFGNGPLNHLVKPTESVSSILDGSTVNIKQMLSRYDTFYDFLTNHPKIKQNWENYTKHPFVKAVAENKLEFDKFLYFLKQDYHYLINYAQVHGLAASTAPNYKQTHAQATIIGEIVTEIEKHKEKLMKNYNIDYDKDIEKDLQLQPGPACKKYCDYLLKVGKSEDFLGIKVAVAPCLHGYARAGVYGQSIRTTTKDSNNVTQDQSIIYQTWLDDYTSDWYTNADKEGKLALQSLISESDINSKRIEELVDMFNEVTLLEIEFWNECLNL